MAVIPDHDPGRNDGVVNVVVGLTRVLLVHSFVLIKTHFEISKEDIEGYLILLIGVDNHKS